MAGYILEFRDETEKQELLDKLYKAKDEICAAIECLEDAEPEEGQMQERRSRMSRRDSMGYRSGMNHRGRMRDERIMRDERDEMEYRNGRYY